MKTYAELRKINVNDHVEKKGGLTYLSWAWAVDTLLQNDPAATWEFTEPVSFGDTMMVSCQVSAFGKIMKMHLPVMDNRNNAIKSPDARKINDAMMRCLTKCIALFGIGLYIYAGEDLPADQEAEPVDVDALLDTISNATTIDELKAAYFAAYEQCKGNQEAQKQIDDAKNKRKGELS
jgi:hypothetical protein